MKHLLLILTLLMGSIAFSAPVEEIPALNKPPRLYMKGTSTQTDYVEITYEVTFEGFVELHLFNQDGKKIWIQRSGDRSGRRR